jgi:hypothetical protein
MPLGLLNPINLRNFSYCARFADGSGCLELETSVTTMIPIGGIGFPREDEGRRLIRHQEVRLVTYQK